MEVRLDRSRRIPFPTGAMITAALILFSLAPFPEAAFGTTLKEMFELAGPRGEYEKVVELETGAIYTGGLIIGKMLSPLSNDLEGEEGLDVHIVGNGAILDLQGREICISFCQTRLDIEDCVVLNGNIRFRGVNTYDHVEMPRGSVRQVTFYGPHDYGVRTQGCGSGILIERNLVVRAEETGSDYIYTNGMPNDWLPTGISYALSGQIGFYGFPDVRENWTFHPDPLRNADPLTHFTLLCEYG